MTTDKRYQVFLSSTYEDLQRERAAVIQALLELKCLPITMDYFPATDGPPWELIEREITSCDYFVVVVAGRYGSIHKTSRLSFTEREYQYAAKLGKPIVAFICEDTDKLTGDKLEKSAPSARKLELFRERLLAKKNVRFYGDPADLGRKVAHAMQHQFAQEPAAGWVRADVRPAGYGELFKIGDCAEEIVSLARQCTPSDKLVIESVGLDLSFGSDYIAKFVRACGAGSMQYKALAMTSNPDDLGPLRPKGVEQWSEYVNTSVSRIADGVTEALKGRRGSRLNLTGGIREYVGLPVIHGTMVRTRRRAITYCSLCRILRREATYDWGENAYRRVEHGAGTPSDVHLAESLEGLFQYLWTRSKKVWECAGNGGAIETDAASRQL